MISIRQHCFMSQLGIDTFHDSSIVVAAHDSWIIEPCKSSCLEGTRMQYTEGIAD